ncbi:hypothetical protein C8T65DRAFT_699748 [Cerioporus squamosus]|nr:hypothetical protein C8T65DRAFT_699748 [Cerioporus squamosus]
MTTPTSRTEAKRRRAETESQGSDPSVQHARNTPTATPSGNGGKPAVKRRKELSAPSNAAESFPPESVSTAGKSKAASSQSNKQTTTPASEKEAAGSEAQDPIAIGSDTESAVNSDGEQSVSAVKARTRTAAQLAGVKVANGRRARFAQKHVFKSN